MSTADEIRHERNKRIAQQIGLLPLTKEEIESLADFGPPPPMSALKVAEETVALGLASDLGPAFTPQDGEHPLGTVVSTEDGVGVVIEYADQVTSMDIDARGVVQSKTVERRTMVHLDDGTLKVYPNDDLTPVGDA